MQQSGAKPLLERSILCFRRISCLSNPNWTRQARGEQLKWGLAGSTYAVLATSFVALLSLFAPSQASAQTYNCSSSIIQSGIIQAGTDGFGQSQTVTPTGCVAGFPQDTSVTVSVLVSATQTTLEALGRRATGETFRPRISCNRGGNTTVNRVVLDSFGTVNCSYDTSIDGFSISGTFGGVTSASGEVRSVQLLENTHSFVENVDTVRPSATIVAPDVVSSRLEFPITVIFSEEIAGLTRDSLSVVGAEILGFAFDPAAPERRAIYRIRPSGAQEIRLRIPDGAVQDTSGNPNTSSEAVVRFDDAGPAAQSVVLLSTNPNPRFATIGDTITLSMTFDEDLPAPPSVSLRGENITPVQDGSARSWTASVQITGIALEGPMPIWVSGIRDSAGNTGSPITATTDSSQVIVDRTAPKIRNTRTFSCSALGIGDNLRTLIYFQESVTEPVVTIAGQTATLSPLGATSAPSRGWAATTTIDETALEGNPTLDVADAKDEAGNLQVDYQQTLACSIDTSAPAVESARLVSSNTNPSFAGLGDTVTLFVTFAEPLTTAPLITLLEQTVAAEGSGQEWSASVEVDASTSDGQALFEVSGYVDASGNPGDPVTRTTDGSRVIVDRTVPTLTITGIPETFQPGDVFSATFTFDEEVSGFTTDDVLVSGASNGELSGGPRVFAMDLTPTGTSNVTVEVQEGAAQDVNGVLSLAASAVSRLDTTRIAGEQIASFMFNRARSLIQNQPGLAGLLNGRRSGNFDAQVTQGFSQVAIDSGKGPVWFSMRGSISEIETGQETAYALATLGTHVSITPNLLLGGLLQLDYAAQDDEAGHQIRGDGWMAGPYIVARLADQPIYFEGRLLYGESKNDITIEGMATDTFYTERLLGLAAVEGTYEADGFTFYPRLQLSHTTDLQHAYFDNSGGLVPEQQIRLEEISAGVDFEIPLVKGRNDHIFTAGLSAIMSRFRPDDEAKNYISYSEETRVRVDLGYLHDNGNGLKIKSALFVDGLGTNDFETSGLELSLSVNF